MNAIVEKTSIVIISLFYACQFLRNVRVFEIACLDYSFSSRLWYDISLEMLRFLRY